VAPTRVLEDPALLQALSGGVAPAGERIADALRRAVTLRMFADERLPPERELAQLLGVSRITVRQAIETLRAEGRVRSVSGRGGGTFQILNPPSKHWKRRTEIAWQELMDVVEFRGLIEPLATRLAATRITKPMLGRLQASIDEMASSTDLEGFRHADSVFHLLLAEAAENARLLRTILVARADFLVWRDRLPIPFVPGDNVGEHGAVLDALRTHDEDAAEAAMVAHLKATKTDFRREIRRLGISPRAGRMQGAARRRPARARRVAS
jgi:DNA-binding FadR family transcriptional regulator